MVDTRALRGIWTGRGYTQAQVAKEIGVKPNTMTRRMKTGVFGSDEIEKLIVLLNIEDPMNIFFAPKVT